MESKHGFDYYLLQGLLKEFGLVGIIDDTRFGEVGIFKSRNPAESGLFAKIVFIQPNQQDQSSLLYKILTKNINIDHPNLLRFVYAPVFLYQSPNGSRAFAFTFEIFDQDLGTLIKKKSMEKTFFTEAQLLKIIRGVLNGLAFMQRYNQYHGCINPDNIFLCNANPKIAIPSLFQHNQQPIPPPPMPSPPHNSNDVNEAATNKTSPCYYQLMNGTRDTTNQ
jgi:hypothetical protein